MSLTTRVLIALVAGMAAGIAISVAGSPQLTRIAFAIEPLGTLWINAIRMTVLPLVVGALIVGIASAPDAKSIGRIGRGALVYFLITLFAGAVFAALLAPPLLALIPMDPAATEALRASAATASGTATENASRIPTFSQWLVDLVPANPVRAAADGALLPLIIFTLVFGLAITRLPEDRRSLVVGFFQGIGDAALTLVRWVLELAPIGVFALSLPLAVRMGVSAAGAVAAFIGILIVITVLFSGLVLYPLAVVLGRVRLGDFARAALPAQAVAFSARSSLASLPAMIASARERLRLPPEITGFLLPLAASTYRVGGALGITTSVLFVARLYGVEITSAQLATIVLTTVVTTFSVPGIPAGSIVVMVPILMAAGVPVEGIGILLGIDTIPDMFRTTANVTGTMSAAAVLGARARRDGAEAVVDGAGATDPADGVAAPPSPATAPESAAERTPA